MFDTSIKIIFIIIVTACSAMGQAVTINHIHNNFSFKAKRSVFSKNDSSILVTPFQGLIINSTSYTELNLHSSEKMYVNSFRMAGTMCQIAYNKTYKTETYTIDGVYLKSNNLFNNSYAIKVLNKKTHEKKFKIFNFGNDPEDEQMFQFLMPTKEFRNHVAIIEDTLFLLAINEQHLYLVEYDIIKDSIVGTNKIATNSIHSGENTRFHYKIFANNDSQLLITFTNQIYQILLDKKKINKYVLPEKYIIEEIIQTEKEYILLARNSHYYREAISFICLDMSSFLCNWSYKLELKYNNLPSLDYQSKIFERSGTYFFSTLNYSAEFFNSTYSTLLDINFDAINTSMLYIFPGKLQDIIKINDDHFKITGTVNKDYNETEEAIFYGDLFFDGRGECPLDTTCLQIDTLDNFTITAIEDIDFENAEIILEEATIEIDSTTYSSSPLACKDYKHNMAGEFALLNDTICYSELPYIFEYETGYYDSSHWKIFLNDSLVYSESIEAPDLNTIDLKEGKIFMEHLLLISGCEFYHEDSVILIRENPINILSNKESICPDENALLSIINTGVSPVISTSWYNHKMENIGTGDSIRIYKPGIYEARLDNGFCQWSETVNIGERQGDCGSSIYIPTAFTPNEDGNNDTWTVFSRYPLEVVIEIYDRWGECVYSCQGTDCSWDGTFKERDMPPGIYVYKVEAMIPEKGETFYETGTLELLR